MQISRMDLADKGSPEGIVMAILKAEPNLPIPVPIEELCRQLDIIEIQALTTQGFEGGLLVVEVEASGDGVLGVVGLALGLVVDLALGFILDPLTSAMARRVAS